MSSKKPLVGAAVVYGYNWAVLQSCSPTGSFTIILKLEYMF